MLQRKSGVPPLLRVSESPAPGNESRITEQGQSLKTCSLVQGLVTCYRKMVASVCLMKQNLRLLLLL